MCQSELSCGHRGRAVPAARSRCSAIGNKNACAATVLRIKPGARHPAPGGAVHTTGKAASPIRGISKGCPLGSLLHPFLERKGWRTVSAARWRCSAIGNKNACAAAMSQTRLSARLALRRSVGGFGGSRRFFGTSRGNPVVLAPGIGRKIAAHTAGKAASPIRGISKGSTPWITFASFS